MQLVKIINARAALCRLCEIRFKSFAVSRNLCTLRKKVDEETEFFQSEQRKAIEAYAEMKDGAPVLIDSQHIKLKSEEAKVSYELEMQKLLGMEIDDITTVTVIEADFRSGEDYPTPEEMIALDGLVEFKEG